MDGLRSYNFGNYGYQTVQHCTKLRKPDLIHGIHIQNRQNTQKVESNTLAGSSYEGNIGPKLKNLPFLFEKDVFLFLISVQR